jgi:hypothetical protein
MAEEVHAREWLRLGTSSSIWAGEDHRFYQVFKAAPPGKYRMASSQCKTLCGRPLKRLHWTCLFCRMRRVAIGELPPEFGVDLVLFTKRRGRRLERQRNFLIKKLMNLIEFLGA